MQPNKEKDRVPQLKPSVPRMPASNYKPSPSRQITQAFSRLKHLLLTEWCSIRSMNLGG